MTERERLMTIRELAEWLSIPVKSAYRAVEEDGLPVVRVGRRLRFRASEVEQWLRARAAR